MAILDAKSPAFQASTKAITPTKAETKTLEGKAPLSVDGGGSLPPTTRLLLKDQASQPQNGLWEVTKNEAFASEGNFAGSGNFAKGNTWALKRPEDADSGADVTDGMLVPVKDGATNQQTSWIQRTPDPIEVGVTVQTFEALVAGARGTASGDLEGTFSAPSVAEAVIDNAKVKASAAIKASKLDLKEQIASTDLATSAKELSPQLVEAGKRKINSGTQTLEFTGGASTSTVEIAHGLGATPKSVLVTLAQESPGIVGQAFGYGETKFKLNAWANFAVGPGSKVTVAWQAFG